MELIRGISNVKSRHQQVVATIGNFDGIHLGHQAVIEALVSKARALAVPSMVIVFEPHPQEFFQVTDAPARLFLLRDKFEQIAKLGVDYLLCLKFDKFLARMTAEAFIIDLLVNALAIRSLIIGDDFRFGHKRRGDFAMLREFGDENSFEVTSLSSFIQSSNRVSSTAIRRALHDNELGLAARYLGESYAIRGRVRHGDKRGRTIGFPTANIALKRVRAPVAGVYAITATVDGHTHLGVANVGKRPTVGGDSHQLEVHLFDFNREIYGQRVCVAFVAKVREEKTFSSLQDLKQQIASDCELARVLLAQAV